MSGLPTVDRHWVTLLRPGDLVVVAQGVGEPTSLLNDVLDAAPDVQVFVGLSHSTALSAPRAKLPRLVSFGAMGPLGAIAQAGALEIIPCNFVDVPRTLRARVDQRLVVLLQVCPADDHGRHSLGMAADYTYELLDDAALVVAEINDQMAPTSAPVVRSERIDVAVPISRPLPQVIPRGSSEVQTHRRPSRRTRVRRRNHPVGLRRAGIRGRRSAHWATRPACPLAPRWRLACRARASRFAPPRTGQCADL